MFQRQLLYMCRPVYFLHCKDSYWTVNTSIQVKSPVLFLSPTYMCAEITRVRTPSCYSRHVTPVHTHVHVCRQTVAESYLTRPFSLYTWVWHGLGLSIPWLSTWPSFGGHVILMLPSRFRTRRQRLHSAEGKPPLFHSGVLVYRRWVHVGLPQTIDLKQGQLQAERLDQKELLSLELLDPAL